MSLYHFQYPYATYFFSFELLEVVKEIIPPDVSLKMRYSLENDHPSRFVVPIHISHFACLDCKAEKDFEKDGSEEIYSDRVRDLQNNKTMFGYGDDHHVCFEPGDKKEFLVLFQPAGRDFETFDIEFFMKPDEAAYGLYRLRYDLRTGQVTGRYCLRTYPAPM